MEQSNFVDGLMEEIHDCILAYAASMSHNISFPESMYLISSKVSKILQYINNLL